MFGNSPQVESNQPDIHPNIEKLLRRHLDSAFLQPFHQHSKQAFAKIRHWRDAEKPLILDSGCGTGESSLRLAKQHPEAQVLGVDKSANRLQKQPEDSSFSNALCVQVDILDLWRWLVAEDEQLWKHYLLYPNPWPKSIHIQRRWHGSAIFPELLQLGGIIHLRSNWQLYILEFAHALSLLDIEHEHYQLALNEANCLTPFERKYLASGHELWVLESGLPRNLSREACLARLISRSPA